MNEHIKANASKFGLIIAGISVGYTLVAYLIDLKLMVNYWMGILLIVTNLVLMIVAVAQAKKKMGGFMEFKDAFTTFILTYLINGLIVTLFSIALFVYIDPEVTETLKELTIEKSLSMMEKWNMPEEQMEVQMAALESQDSYSLGSLTKSFLLGIIAFSVIGLIVAAVMKKNKPAHLEDYSADEFGENE